MSRLDSVIRRLQAQRACIDRAIELAGALPGPVLELGLGNGRTYDHLRQRLPGRDIYVFERQVAAHPDCVPPERFLLLGDLLETVPAAAARLPAPAALAHADIGTGDEEASERLAALLAPHLRALMAPGGIVASDQRMPAPGLVALPLPDGIEAGRYHLYRALSRRGLSPTHSRSTITGTWSDARLQPRVWRRMRACRSEGARGGLTQM